GSAMQQQPWHRGILGQQGPKLLAVHSVRSHQAVLISPVHRTRRSSGRCDNNTGTAGASHEHEHEHEYDPWLWGDRGDQVVPRRECAIGIVIEQEYVAHLAARCGRVLAVEMESRLWPLEYGLPRRRSSMPKVADQIHHDRAGRRTCIAEC